MAPMKDVTDVAFRQLVAKSGAPDVFWTEFVSADGLYYTQEIAGKSEKSSAQAARPIQHDFSDSPAHKSNNPLVRDLAFMEEQRPIVAQIFSSKPEMIAYATKLVAGLGFDGVDINMGCPDRTVEKQGAGAAMIKNPKLAQEIIRTAKQAALEAAIPNPSYRTDLVLSRFPIPVSVKTRIGYNTESLDEWLTALLEAGPAAITLHLRTRKDMSLVSADWEQMKKAVEIRNRVNPDVLLIGNGDVQDLADARAKAIESGCDGVMLGRAMFGNPWVFAGRKSEDTPLAEKLAALIELAHSFEKISPPKNFSILKKHIKAFVTGFNGAAELRALLMQAENAFELERILRENPV